MGSSPPTEDKPTLNESSAFRSIVASFIVSCEARLTMSFVRSPNSLLLDDARRPCPWRSCPATARSPNLYSDSPVISLTLALAAVTTGSGRELVLRLAVTALMRGRAAPTLRVASPQTCSPGYSWRSARRTRSPSSKRRRVRRRRRRRGALRRARYSFSWGVGAAQAKMGLGARIAAKRRVRRRGCQTTMKS